MAGGEEHKPLVKRAFRRVCPHKIVELLFPGSHSDVGGLYDDRLRTLAPRG